MWIRYTRTYVYVGRFLFDVSTTRPGVHWDQSDVEKRFFPLSVDLPKQFDRRSILVLDVLHPRCPRSPTTRTSRSYSSDVLYSSCRVKNIPIYVFSRYLPISVSISPAGLKTISFITRYLHCVLSASADKITSQIPRPHVNIDKIRASTTYNRIEEACGVVAREKCTL